MNQDKALFFDSQVNAPWAAGTYSYDELQKIERLLEILDIEPGMKILEPGCGTGRLTAILSRKLGEHGKIVAMDISSAMVTVAKQNAPFSNVEIHHGALEDYLAQMAEPGYHRIICHNVFPHFDNKMETLLKMANALKDKGMLIIFHFMNSGWINDLHRKTSPVVFNDIMPNYTEMKKMMETAGLSVEHFTDDENGYLLSSVR